jgi:hypothetical protein
MSSQPTAPKLKKMMPLDGHHNFFPAGYDLWFYRQFSLIDKYIFFTN